MIAVAIAGFAVAAGAIALAVTFGLWARRSEASASASLRAELMMSRERDTAYEQSALFEAQSKAASSDVLRLTDEAQLLRRDLDDAYNDLGTCGDPVVVRRRIADVLQRARERAIVPAPATGTTGDAVPAGPAADPVRNGGG